MTLLIEDFEEKAYALKPAKPIEILNELIEANSLKQKDLVDAFGTPSIVSEVLNGKRGLTIEHIKKLSHRFHVSPEVFFEQICKGSASSRAASDVQSWGAHGG